jgi:hypothetical protein
MATVASNRPAPMYELRLGLRTYANLVTSARLQSNRPPIISLRAQCASLCDFGTRTPALWRQLGTRR